jgi:hypothetical protein
VITGFEQMEDGRIRATNLKPADSLVVSPFFWIYTDDAIGDRMLEGGYMLQARCFEHWDCGSSVGHDKSAESFAQLCQLELRLDSHGQVAECDEEKI